MGVTLDQLMQAMQEQKDTSKVDGMGNTRSEVRYVTF